MKWQVTHTNHKVETVEAEQYRFQTEGAQTWLTFATSSNLPILTVRASEIARIDRKDD